MFRECIGNSLTLAMIRLLGYTDRGRPCASPSIEIHLISDSYGLYDNVTTIFIRKEKCE